MPASVTLPPVLARRLEELRGAANSPAGAPGPQGGTGPRAGGLGRGAAAKRLSDRYRADRPAQAPIIDSSAAALAYVTTRMPATFAAARFALEQLALVVPALRPVSLLDLGAGTGAGTAAAWDTWGSLTHATLVDHSAAALALAQATLEATDLTITTQLDQLEAAPSPTPDATPHDLAIACYVLSELTPEQRTAALRRLTDSAGQAVVLVEPGTPAGYRRIIEARRQLLELGWRIAAPCPHESACPLLTGPDWCHAAVRLPRTREHRIAKDAERGFEDEKFSWVAALPPRTAATSPEPATSPDLPDPLRPLGRVLRHPETRPGHIRLELCTREGVADSRTVTKRDKAAFRAARKVEWGEAWQLDQATAPSDHPTDQPTDHPSDQSP